MQEQNARIAGADAAQRIDKQRRLQSPRFGEDQPGEERPVGHRQRDHRAFERRVHQLRQGQGKDQLRQGEEHVGDPHDGLRHPAAAIAGDEAERHADSGGEDDDDQRHFERAARPEDHARQHVPAEIVGAERESAGGRFQPLQQVRGGGVLRVGCEPRPENRDEDDRQYDNRAQQGRQVAREFLQDQHRTDGFAVGRRGAGVGGIPAERAYLFSRDDVRHAVICTSG